MIPPNRGMKFAGLATRSAAALLLWTTCASPVAAQPALQDPRLPQTPEERQFHSAVSRAIYQVMPREPERFVLALADRANPVFPGEAAGHFEQVRCEKLAAFAFLGYANQLGSIAATHCMDASRVRELAAKSRARLAATLKALSVSDEDARKAGWYYAAETLGDGSEFFYFPVLAVGHGVLGAFTGVLLDRNSGAAAVIQAMPYPMCEGFRRHYESSPFCADMRQALRRIAQTLQGAP